MNTAWSNVHLQEIFDLVLPTLLRAGVQYWVYGGVGVAGIVGEFIRENKDIDIFVLGEENFNQAKKVLEDLCKEKGRWDGEGWELRYSVLRNGRPKVELFIKNDEVLSVVPVYKMESGRIEFRSPNPKILGAEALNSVERKIGNYRFFSPPDVVVKDILEHYLNSRRRIPKGSLIDARHLGIQTTNVKK